MIALSSKRWHGVVGRGEVDFLRQRRGDLDESHQLFSLTCVSWVQRTPRGPSACRMGPPGEVPASAVRHQAHTGRHGPWLSLSSGQVKAERIDQFPYLCQVMIIVLRNKMQMIHEPHRLLETRMQARSCKSVRFKCPHMVH